MSDDVQIDPYRAFVDARAQIELLNSTVQYLMLEHLEGRSLDEKLKVIDQLELSFSNRPLDVEGELVSERQAQIDVSTALGEATKHFAERMRGFVRASAPGQDGAQ